MMRESRWLFLLLFFFLIHSADAWFQEHGSDLSSEVSISFRWPAGAPVTPCRREPSMPGLALFRFDRKSLQHDILPKTKKRGSAVGRTNRIRTPSLREFDATVATYLRDAVSSLLGHGGRRSESAHCISQNPQAR